MYLDSYPCFGWEEDPNAETVQERIHPGGNELKFSAGQEDMQ